MNTDILILLPVFLPIAAGLLMLAFPAEDDRVRNKVNMIFVLINTALAFIAMTVCKEKSISIVRIYMNYGFEFKTDRAACIFGTIVASLWPFASLYSYGYMKGHERRNSFFAFFTMTYGVVMGIAFASNLLTMYVFYEMLTLVTFPLVLHPMTKKAIKAARTYLAYSLGGAAFGLIGLIFMMYLGSTGFTLGGSITADSAASAFLLPAFVLSFCGFSVKAAMAPFSGWLIKAAVAPTPVTALLHAVAVVNAGAFACIRLIYYVYGTDILHGTWAQYLVLLMTAVTIVYGSSFAVKETHFKRRLAYSTISNLSYILFAATIMTPMGLTAAFAHMLMHSLTKICSFFCCGIVMEQTGKEYIEELSGLGRVMKKTFVCFTISSLSLIGIPLFCGFFSKWRIGLAAIDEGSPFAITGLVAILFSALLTAIYMLGIVIKAYFPMKADSGETENSAKDGAEEDPSKVIKEHSWQMLIPVICFAAGILILGAFWQPVLDFIQF